jgi:hypothetical protein
MQPVGREAAGHLPVSGSVRGCFLRENFGEIGRFVDVQMRILIKKINYITYLKTVR